MNAVNGLPYITLKIGNQDAKILIDSGANKNFISPSLVNQSQRESCKPISITNSTGKHKTDQCFTTKIFKKHKKVTFYLYKFHTFFDGILGYETLSEIEAILDIGNNKLILPDETINLQIRKLGLPDITIKANSTNIIEMPVSCNNCDVFLPKNIRINDTEIPAGLYKSENGLIRVPATNFGEDVTFFWTKPAKVYPIFAYMEVNNTAAEPFISTNNLENLIRTEHLNSEERTSLLKLLSKNTEIIHNKSQKLSCTTAVKHEIKTVDNVPIHTKSYRYPHIHKPEVEKQINEMLTDGIIQHSLSPWTSPIWIVPKKADASGKQKWRIVVDYRKLNEKTIDDKFPIPNIEEILDRLGRSTHFTTLDLKSGFHQIEVDPKDRQKTAFSTEKGHFEFVRMPFGLKNAPSTFQRAMTNILSDLIGKCCLVYLDDIIIFGNSLQQHLENLDKVLKRLIEANLKIQPDKCEFLRKECEFLGHIVTSDGIKPNPNKIEKITNWPLPKTTSQIKGFLGLLGYYRKFIKDFAKLTKPLTKCLKKEAKIVHDEEFLNCFKECKQLLVTDPVLKYPDFSRKFILETDASDFALGAVLSQKFEDGKEHPIAYASRTLSDTECRYSATEKELLAIIYATKHFRPYIYGTKFEIRTDHKPLLWLRQKNDLNRKLLRWKLDLEEFEFEIKYKKGTLNNNADSMSRIEPENQINANSTDDDMTQHSADTDDGDFIGSTERPLNEFRNQIILEQSNEDSREHLTIFRNYTRTIIKKPEFSPGILINILKDFASPNCVNGLYCHTDILRPLQTVYKNYFSRAKALKILWTEKLLIDVTDELEQDQIIEKQHELNHRGIVETSKHISIKFFFPKLKSKVTKFINICRLCQKAKYERHPYKMKYKLTETPTKPLQIVHMDIFIIREKNYLTFCDRFSRLAMAIPIRTRNTIHIIKALTTFMANLGKPQLLIMDQEAAFTSTAVRSFLDENQVQFHFTSVAQSSSNGSVEIIHRTLREIQNILSLKDSTKDLSITTQINLAVSIYNDSIHSQTNITPKELFYGFRNGDPVPEDLDERIALKEKMYSEFREKIFKEKQKFIDNLNKTRENPENFVENEILYLRKRNNLKHQERYKEVKVAENRDVNFIDEHEQKYHKSKLKRKRKTQ